MALLIFANGTYYDNTRKFVNIKNTLKNFSLNKIVENIVNLWYNDIVVL